MLNSATWSRLHVGCRADLPAQRRTIDIVTIGARTGRRRRIEIWFWEVGGELYLSSEPGPRSWFANLSAHPEFVVHAKNHGGDALPARAEIVAEEGPRRRVLPSIMRQSRSHRHDDPEPWIRDSPLVRFGPRVATSTSGEE